MPGESNRAWLASALLTGMLLAGGFAQPTLAQTPGSLSGPSTEAATLTNIAQLCQALGSPERLYRDLRLEGVLCAASQPSRGAVVLQDGTGVELLELGQQAAEFRPGEKIRIEGTHLLLRRRELGIQISKAPVVDNDGLHAWRTVTGEVRLQAGRNPLELDWFNCFHNYALEVSVQSPDGQAQRIASATLSHAGSAGSADWLPGLEAECFEGYWESVPDFALLQPVKTGSTTNFDLSFRTQDELVGLRYKGFFDAPKEGLYSFRVGSDDGSLLFVGPAEVPIQRLGLAPVPAPQEGWIGQPMNGLNERRWLVVRGRVSFVSQSDGRLTLELRSGPDTVTVKVADASGIHTTDLLNNYLRVVGVGRAALLAGQRLVLDQLIVPDGRGLQRVELETQAAAAELPLATIRQVQTIQPVEANRALPVRIRGVVTCASRSYHWVALQDDTRGIFVDHHSLSNTFPATAEWWEVVGHTARGNFAPVVVAERMTRLGQGRLPEPARPPWNQLGNGSMDVQWVEFQGLVSSVQSNRLALRLPEGALEVSMDNYLERELKQYEQAVVRIRGTLFATWNADTREVQFGSLLMRNGALSVEAPPPIDPFNAPVKTARDLLLFDAQATAFHPIKVRGQILYAGPEGVFALDEGLGLRLVPAAAVELEPGDLVEAVGYPELSGPSPLLRQALVRKTGSAPLPKPRILAGPDLVRKGLDSTWVSVAGKLMAMHSEPNAEVLEIQSHGQLFVARVKAGSQPMPSLRLGSRLQLCGVYADTGRNHPPSQVELFELLLNSPLGLTVLSQPSWWTLERLGAVVGFLVVVLMLAGVWITQLRRKVEQRTAQLHREIRERERAEHHHALEAERSRIARDLHDDLGASLTEIGVLASTGQRANVQPETPALFDAIAGKARTSIAALDVIVWAVDPEDNSLQSLADYLSGFAGEYLSTANVGCRFKIPVSCPAIMLEGRVRHDLFLTVKESLNNIVRHAAATEVEFALAATDGALEITLADNGRGFDTSVVSAGNGLKNLRERLARLGGRYEAESRLGGGTRVRIRLPLPIREPNGVTGL